MGNQKGFTLIELVMVIVVLGILAAGALPRFADLSTDARKSSIDALEGAMRSAMAVTYSKSLVNGTDKAADSSITLENTAVATVYGYPATAAIDEALNAFDGFTFDGSGLFTQDGAPTPADCSVLYAQPASAGASPGITAKDGGC